MNLKEHWEHIYSTKNPNEVSWTEAIPKKSLELFQKIQLPKTASIIDVGAGESHFVDVLLDLGYSNITLLDVSAQALEKTKTRLGERGNTIHYIVSDITTFQPKEHYDYWHDRAVFHFLKSEEQIHAYSTIITTYAKYISINTFSKKGPLKCSGLEIEQYDLETLTTLLNQFSLIESFEYSHITPFDTQQEFIYTLFQNIN